MAKLNVINSQMGRKPLNAAPTAMPESNEKIGYQLLGERREIVSMSVAQLKFRM